MSHSKIFQISRKPIDPDDYKSPSDYYDDHRDFADWIGDEVDDEDDRKHCIECLVKELDGVFSIGENDTIVFNGSKPLNKFLESLANQLKGLVNGMKKETLVSGSVLRNLRLMATDTHKYSDYRIDIEDYTCCAAPLCDLIDYAAWELKKGKKLYIGAIIDYHY